MNFFCTLHISRNQKKTAILGSAEIIRSLPEHWAPRSRARIREQAEGNSSLRRRQRTAASGGDLAIFPHGRRGEPEGLHRGLLLRAPNDRLRRDHRQPARPRLHQ